MKKVLLLLVAIATTGLLQAQLDIQHLYYASLEQVKEYSKEEGHSIYDEEQIDDMFETTIITTLQKSEYVNYKHIYYVRLGMVLIHEIHFVKSTGNNFFTGLLDHYMDELRENLYKQTSRNDLYVNPETHKNYYGAEITMEHPKERVLVNWRKYSSKGGPEFFMVFSIPLK